MAELRFSLTSMSVGRLVKHKHGVLYLQDRRGEMDALTHWLTVREAMTDKLGREDKGRSSLSWVQTIRQISWLLLSQLFLLQICSFQPPPS